MIIPQEPIELFADIDKGATLHRDFDSVYMRNKNCIVPDSKGKYFYYLARQFKQVPKHMRKHSANMATYTVHSLTYLL